MSDTVLFVDEEKYVLNSIGTLFSDTDISVDCLPDAEEALNALNKEEIAVLVSGTELNGSKGADLLAKAKDISPETLRILMTPHSDLNVAVEAVNRGMIFRFIIKPWDNDALIQIIRDAVSRYRLVKSLRYGDEPALLHIAQTIESKDSYTRGHCESVARYSLMIADALNLSDERKTNLKYGSWLHDCGKIGVPENVLNKKGPLDEYEFEIIKNHPRWGADITRSAQLPEIIVKIIRHHHERYDGSGYPSGIRGNSIPFEARIVTLADVFDVLTSKRPYREMYGREKAINIIKMMRGNVLDPEIVDIFLYKCLNLRKHYPTLPRNKIVSIPDKV